MQTLKQIWLTTLGLVFACATALAQVTGAGLRGFVYDEQRAPLAGATVSVVHGPTGTHYETVTNEKGRFVLDGLRPGGPYQVEVYLIGKKGVEVEDVTVNVDARAGKVALAATAAIATAKMVKRYDIFMLVLL